MNNRDDLNNLSNLNNLSLASIASFACNLFASDDKYKVHVDKDYSEITVTVEKDNRKAYFVSDNINLLKEQIHERFNSGSNNK